MTPRPSFCPNPLRIACPVLKSQGGILRCREFRPVCRAITRVWTCFHLIHDTSLKTSMRYILSIWFGGNRTGTEPPVVCELHPLWWEISAIWGSLQTPWCFSYLLETLRIPQWNLDPWLLTFVGADSIRNSLPLRYRCSQ